LLCVECLKLQGIFSLKTGRVDFKILSQVVKFW
jgi:hypothetical protein